MSQLRIHLTSEWQDSASTCAWALLDERGALLDSGSGNLASMPRADEAIAILSSELVLCVAVTLPKIKARQLETALPFALEDFLLGEVADSHVVPGERLAGGETLLYSVSRERLRRFVQACEGTGIRLRKALPEYCLLPVQAGEWSAVWDGCTGFLATGQRAGCVLGRGDAQQPPAALTLQLNHAPAKALRLYFKAGLASEQRAWPQWTGIELMRAAQDWDWRSAPVHGGEPDLLWGKFAPRARIQEWWPKMQPLLWLLLIAFAMESLGSNLEWWWLAHERLQVKRAMDGVYQETFGAEATVVDAPLQMRRSLARARHAAGVTDDLDFLPMLDRIAAELGALPGSSVDGVRYADGQLDVEARLPSGNAWETLKRRLGEEGMGVQVMDVRDTGGAVFVRLRLGA